mmetsp:Transcript_6071/g.18088  ORF Transcript_6071/g.18088 Transcript_6071/m.18088 type:complete len:200 (+) Transcript_6071:467-1066(+)
MSTSSFCCRATSRRSVTRSRKALIAGLPRARARSLAEGRACASYCTTLLRGRNHQVCVRASAVGSTACVPACRSARRSSKFGSLKGRHSWKPSWASRSANLAGAVPYSLRRRVTETCSISRRAFTAACAISASDRPSVCQGRGARVSASGSDAAAASAAASSASFDACSAASRAASLARTASRYSSRAFSVTATRKLLP